MGKQQIFFHSFLGTNFTKTVVISKRIELVTPETAQMIFTRAFAMSWILIGFQLIKTFYD